MDRRRLLPCLGCLAILYPAASLFLAIALSPGFSWRAHAFSHLGVTWHEAGTTATAILFNGGLLGGGLMGVFFTTLLFPTVTHTGKRMVTMLLGVTFLCCALLGIFPAGTTPHFPIAIAFFLLVTITLWFDGFVAFTRGEYRWSLTSGGLGTANILTWILWPLVSPNPWALAIPELIAGTFFALWVVTVSISLSDWQ